MAVMNVVSFHRLRHWEDAETQGVIEDKSDSRAYQVDDVIVLKTYYVFICNLNIKK